MFVYTFYRKMGVDKRKFLRAKQQPKHYLALEKRKQLWLLPVLEKYVKSERHKFRVSLMAAKKSLSTLKSWNRTLVKLHEFLRIRNLNFYTISEPVILDYIFDLDNRGVSYAVVSGQQSAIKFMLIALKLDRQLWSEECQLCYDSVLRRAACEKKRPKKAHILELEAINRAVERYVLLFLNSPEKVKKLLLI